MEISYDRQHNIAYIGFRPRTGDVETLSLSDLINVDIGSDGTLYGIELLNANQQLPAGPDGIRVILTDALSGTTADATLPGSGGP